jgi:beta-RFAP synthase
VEVVAGSRLHFGLTRVDPTGSGRYAGLGVMIQEPATRVRARLASSFTATGPRRLPDLARVWLGHLGLASHALQITAAPVPPAHCGLGSGTQLAQAVAASISAIAGLPAPDVHEVARVLDRGQRSRVGTLGFALGGLVVDPAETGESTVAMAGCSIPIPESWRVVLVRDVATPRTFGHAERAVFARLRQGPGGSAWSERLEHLIDHSIVPAARRADFSSFAEAVFEYGYHSGLYYREIQGGPWNGPAVSGIVERLRNWGVSGAGQSSWGPVVFSWCEDSSQALALADRARSHWGDRVALCTSGASGPARVQLHPQIASAGQCGSTIDIHQETADRQP